MVVRTCRLATAPATETLLYRLVVACVLLAAAFALGQAGLEPTPLAWGNLAFQSPVVSFASFLAGFLAGATLVLSGIVLASGHACLQPAMLRLQPGVAER